MVFAHPTHRLLLNRSLYINILYEFYNFFNKNEKTIVHRPCFTKIVGAKVLQTNNGLGVTMVKVTKGFCLNPQTINLLENLRRHGGKTVPCSRVAEYLIWLGAEAYVKQQGAHNG